MNFDDAVNAGVETGVGWGQGAHPGPPTLEPIHTQCCVCNVQVRWGPQGSGRGVKVKRWELLESTMQTEGYLLTCC